MKIYKTNIEIERYEGIWAFSYISDYILSIVPQDKNFVIILQDISVSENVKLIPLKISSFFMDFFVRGSLDNIRIRIYPKTKSGKIGIEIKDKEYVRSTLTDGRTIEVIFKKVDENTTEVIQVFEPEEQYSREMQRTGWYAILDRFHKYVENN